MIVDYEILVGQFEDSLLNTLRGHAAAVDFLETWVPDEDPVRGVLNMVEAAQAADRYSIDISISLQTLPPARHPELSATLGALGQVSLRMDGGRLIVSVSKSDPEAAFEETSADLRNGLRKTFAELRHEGPLPTDQGGIPVSAEAEGVSISLMIDPQPPHAIRAACHAGGRQPSERAILDAVCRAAKGAPLLDAADHAGIRALHWLRDRHAARPVPGILQPGNADPSVALGVRLLREARGWFLEGQGLRPDVQNDYDELPSSAWLPRSNEARLADVADAIRAFLGGIGIGDDAIDLVALEDDLHDRPVRVMISFGDEVAPDLKPRLMRRLEYWLKDNLEEMLQVYLEQRKDKNVTRRL